MEKWYMGINGWLPPLEKSFKDFPYWGKGWLIQEKINGVWCACIKERKNNLKIYYRNGKKIFYHTVEYISMEMNDFLPEHSIVIGELVQWHENKFMEKNTYNTVILFDVLRWEKTNMCKYTTLERFDFLQERMVEFNEEYKTERMNLVNNEYLYLSEKFNRSKAWDFLEERLKGGCEGIILKNANYLYYPGERTSEYIKCKRNITQDYICMKFETIRGKIRAMLCGLIQDTEIKSVMRIPLDDFYLKEQCIQRPDDFIGKVVEVGGYRLFKSGALYRPYFISFREDKEAKECIL
jgi:ATP-dependent DNA ligase